MLNPFMPDPVLETEKRCTHAYIIGQPGTGKSRLLESWIMQDICAGNGVCLIDPHGDLYQRVLAKVARMPNIWNRVVVIDPLNPYWAVQLNPLHVTGETTPERIAWFLSDIILKIWKMERNEAPRMTWLMVNTFCALADLQLPITTTSRFLLDREYHTRKIEELRNESAKSYFLREYPKQDNVIQEWVSPLLNKLGSFLQDPDIAAMFTDSIGINMLDLMNRKCIILVQIPKGILGENTSDLLGAFIVAQIQQAAFAREKESTRKPFYLYLDEFQNYTTDNISDILSESRKYQLSMVLAHQYLKQLDDRIQAAILNTSGTIVCFRTGYEDALQLARYVFPTKIFKARTRTKVVFTNFRSVQIPQISDETEKQDWDQLAYLISNQKQREYWVRIRTNESPIHLRSNHVSDVSITKELEENIQHLIDTSGKQYARLKRAKGESEYEINDQSKNQFKRDPFWSD